MSSTDIDDRMYVLPPDTLGPLLASKPTGTPLLQRIPPGWLLAAAAALIAATATYQYVEVRRADNAEVQLAWRTVVGSAPRHLSNQLGRIDKLTGGERAVAMHRVFADPQFGDPTGSSRRRAAEAALRIAMRHDNAEAYLLEGLRVAADTNVPGRESLARDHHRTAVALSTKAANAGDPDAQYVQAMLHLHGLGLPQDRPKALELAVRAASRISSWRWIGIAEDAGLGRPPFDRPDPTLTSTLVNRMAEVGDKDAPLVGAVTCRRWISALSGLSGPRLTQLLAEFDQCRGNWLVPAAKTENAFAMSELGVLNAVSLGDLANAREWLRRSAPNWTPEARLLDTTLAIVNAKDAGTLAAAHRQAEAAIKAVQADSRGVPSPGYKEAIGYVLWLRQVSTAKLSRSEQANVLASARVFADLNYTLRDLQAALRDAPALRPLAPMLQAPDTERNYRDLRSALGLPLPATTAPAKPAPAAASQLRPSPERSAATPSPSPALDAVRPTRSGYLQGQPVLARGGLSTFTVDNSQGAGDAEIRLYRGDGQPPAVRSFVVLQGGRFTAQDLAPGTYTMRYRYLGTEDVYESDRAFQLREIQTETGTSYSTITVTLYQVRDGNMRTRKVSPNSF